MPLTYYVATDGAASNDGSWRPGRRFISSAAHVSW